MRYPILVLVSIVLLSGCITEESRTGINKNITTEGESRWINARNAMVEVDLMGRDITDKKVLDAMSKVPRHEFIPEDLRGQAYEDHPVPIGYGQTISQPYIVALMTQSLKLNGSEKVLEIGTGSGYQAAVLSEIVDEAYTIEIIPELAERANRTLKSLNYRNVEVLNADGYFGWKEKAPFDAIMITAAVDHIPPYLLEQLKDNGKLILPLGSTRYYQTLTLVEKNDSDLKTTHITSVVFVPMTGEIQRR